MHNVKKIVYVAKLIIWPNVNKLIECPKFYLSWNKYFTLFYASWKNIQKLVGQLNLDLVNDTTNDSHKLSWRWDMNQV
jgi:hypothetical protein